MPANDPPQQDGGPQGGGGGGSGGTILYVGDSIGVGMKPYIEDLVDIREYDALGGRPSPPGVTIVKQKLNSSDSAVVFDLGTNDGLVAVTEDSLKEVIDFCSKQNVILGLVPPGSQDANKKNDLMRKLSQDNEGVIYVDTGGLPLMDGIHPTPDGAKQRARLFAEALGDLGEPVDRGGGTTGGTVTSGAGTEDLFAAGRAAAFSTQFEIPGLTDSFANLFSGDKSIYNDQPLLPFIEQLCGASFRHFQSLPDGTFFAFFPDYFGAYGHRKPYWQIDDVEIIDGQIELNDDELATHVFVAGDTNPDGQVDFAEMANSKGVITIFDAFNADPIVPEGEKPPKPTKEDKEEPESAQFARMNARINALDFLTRYGQRPYFEAATFLRNPYFEVFYAYLTFQLMWSKQFLTTFTLTFMPELYPGGIVAFEKYGFQAYIESVDHTFDYESGFTTQANLMAPSALDPTNKTPFSNGLIKPGLSTKSPSKPK